MTSLFEIPWHKYALITYLVERLQSNASIPGKTAIQKLVYFLQEAVGVPCGYEYIFYNYGPYSRDLAADLEYADVIGGVSIKSREDVPAAYAISPGEFKEDIKQRGADFLSRHHEAIERVIRDFGGYPARELELFATIYYAYRFAVDREQPLAKEELIRQVQGLKPRFSLEKITAAVDKLCQVGYIDLCR